MGESFGYEQINFESLIGTVLDDFEMAFDTKNIRVISNIPKDYTFTGDREKFLHLLINLIDNAAKYNRDRGEIQNKLIEEENEFRLSVWNTGIGIPQEHLSNVFDTLFRVEKSRSQKYGGSGLGLTIVNTIALMCDTLRAAEMEAHVQSRTFEMEDAQEGIAALLEKREPHFKGK